MTITESAAKPYKGKGMNGLTAKWYANLTKKSMNDFTHLAQRVASELPRGASVLEVAPGPGYFAIELAKLGAYQITGLDISHDFVKIARANALDAGVSVNFRHGNASAMPFEDNAFDFLLCRAAFKNFTEPVHALNEMHRVLKPGGETLIIDLSRDTPMASIKEAIDKSHVGFVNGIITKLTFRYMLCRRAYTQAEFEKMLAETAFSGFHIQQDGMGLELRLQK